MDRNLNTLKVPNPLSVKRLGPASVDINVRPRPLEITVSSPFEKPTAVANAHLLKGLKVFVKKHCWKDLLKQNNFLEVRCQHMLKRLVRNFFLIRDLKLHYDEISVNEAEVFDGVKDELSSLVCSANIYNSK